MTHAPVFTHALQIWECTPGETKFGLIYTKTSIHKIRTGLERAGALDNRCAFLKPIFIKEKHMSYLVIAVGFVGIAGLVASAFLVQYGFASAGRWLAQRVRDLKNRARRNAANRSNTGE
jgi:hypothetical protein